MIVGLAPGGARRQPDRPDLHRRSLRVTGCSPRLHRAGLANQPTSVSVDDGLRLQGAYVTAVNRCPPPQNRPTTEERDNCLPYLVRELRLLRAAPGDRRARLLSPGRARCSPWRSWGLSCRGRGRDSATARRLGWRRSEGGPARDWSLLGCFHPSQQNTFTGKLTEPMLDAVFAPGERDCASG